MTRKREQFLWICLIPRYSKAFSAEEGVPDKSLPSSSRPRPKGPPDPYPSCRQEGPLCRERPPGAGSPCLHPGSWQTNQPTDTSSWCAGKRPEPGHQPGHQRKEAGRRGRCPWSRPEHKHHRACGSKLTFLTPTEAHSQQDGPQQAGTKGGQGRGWRWPPFPCSTHWSAPPQAWGESFSLGTGASFGATGPWEWKG